MDEGFGEEVAPLGVLDGAHLQSKETEYLVKSGSGVGSQEIMLPTGSIYHDSSSHLLLADILEDKNHNMSLRSSADPLEHFYDNSRSMDDASGLVEELTVRNYDNLNSATVGLSKSRNQVVHGRGNQWQSLYQTTRASESGALRSNFFNHAGSRMHKDMDGLSFPEIMSNEAPTDDKNDVSQQVSRHENQRVQGSDALDLNGGSRTKMLSKSGFSEYFIKNTLKGKGIIHREPPVERSRRESKDQVGSKAASDALVDSAFKNVVPSAYKTSEARANPLDDDGVSLREWLNNGHREVNKVERLDIFKQIVHLVDYSHSEGVPLLELHPSCFRLLPSNQVKYLGQSEGRELPGLRAKSISNYTGWIAMKRTAEPGQLNSFGLGAKHKKFNEDRNHQHWSRFPLITDLKVETASFNENNVCDQWYSPSRSSKPYLPSTAEQKRIIVNEKLEENWYQSPEKHNDGVSRVSSNIYSLGVFLFELLMHFDSERARSSAMMDLRLRILPPSFLLENLEEAGFCLLLLHPDPASRPSSRRILESNVFNGLKGVNGVSSEELTSCIEQEDVESELLLHFLVALEEHKQKDVSKLVQNIKRLESDIEEISRRNCMAKPSDLIPLLSPYSNAESPWVGKMETLETAYFSMRTKIDPPEMDASSRMDNDLLRTHGARNDDLQNSPDPLGAYFDGLCKYARYSKFKARGVMRNCEFNNSANVVCSLSFDRDEDYFAAAGVSKKIRIFEFNSLLNQSVDMHYPVIEMSNRSKLSCVSWNSYIRNYLASTDYDGIVKLWDASTGQAFLEYAEHEKRAWSVDFCPLYPTKLASGGDDCSVKLWNINERKCLGTIKNMANVCSVQFSAHSTHLLAFGSADYRTYCYDLRNVRSPWCVLGEHEKAVSYVNFLDSGTIVTASTDNSLKLWDLHKTSPGGSLSSKDACCLTLGGHTNEKNFVGLSVAGGYITCGSETNEVYAYHRSLPMPITSHKFGSIDPISGKETDEDNGQFVSSVCWRGKSDMLVAANSTGCIKALQIV